MSANISSLVVGTIAQELLAHDRCSPPLQDRWSSPSLRRPISAPSKDRSSFISLCHQLVPLLIGAFVSDHLGDGWAHTYLPPDGCDKTLLSSSYTPSIEYYRSVRLEDRSRSWPMLIWRDPSPWLSTMERKGTIAPGRVARDCGRAHREIVRSLLVFLLKNRV